MNCKPYERSHDMIFPSGFLTKPSFLTLSSLIWPVLN